VTEVIGRPAYQQLADTLRSQIASGELQVGSAIPSTTQLRERYRVSVTVVRAAINQLRADGLVVGQPGKAVYVRTTPDAAANERVQLDDLAEQVKQLRAGFADLTQRLELGADDSQRYDQLQMELAELRRQVGTFHTQLIDLYSRVGQPYPHEAARPPEQDTAARRRRARTATETGN
jgi:DNA-binding GntR family transcriptional regulator